MIPTLNDFINTDEFLIFQTSNHKLGIGLELIPCDLETMNAEIYQKELLSLIRQIPSNAISRLKLEVSQNKNHPHAITKNLKLFVEIQGEPTLIKEIKNLLIKSKDDEEAIRALKDIHALIKKSSVFLQDLAKEDLINSFPEKNTQIYKDKTHLISNCEHIGMLRLEKPLSHEISESSLAQTLKDLPLPFELTLTWQKKPSHHAKLALEKKLKQTASEQKSPTNQSIFHSTSEAIKNALSQGADFIDYEFIVTLKRNSELELQQDLRSSLIVLNRFADFKIESFGAAPSYLATLPGNNTHVTLTELDDTFTLFMPVWHFGNQTEKSPKVHSLPLLRADKSLYHFDLFNKSFSAANTLIIGSSGRGKSVLTGLLTKSLLQDPNIMIMKVDVGGSYKKECSLYNGQEFTFTLNESSNLNPFAIINENISASEKVSILSRFLLVLIKEEGEVTFSKDLKSQVEDCLTNYIVRAKNPSLQEFYDQEINFPRRQLLKRWVNGGVYESAFADSEECRQHRTEVTKRDSEDAVVGTTGSWTAQSNFSGSALQSPSPRLRYYNFSQIFQASDPEFAQAGLAAVLTQFNLESLCNKDKKIVLICDETPFFIKSCFDFFKFTTANVRKFGHSVILITQLSTDLIQSEDTGLIENSPQRFFFTTDGTNKDFKERFQLKDKDLETIQQLKSIPGIMSEVLLQDANATRKLEIRVSQKDYWELTSNMDDNKKLNSIMKLIPELTLKEAISCLSQLS